MSIRLLLPEVVSKIAAGEVVERPASVVKELVENSLDAGAGQIDVEIQGGGIELIRVADNGAGIPASEVELAFSRYATSKISCLEDLDGIPSLGFRGEALPSIAAVAEVELTTKAVSETVGRYLCLRKGAIVRRESRARPQGTTVSVRRLFHYFPARLKFLKSANTETAHTAYLLTQYALAYPEVRFSLLIGRHTSLQTTGTGDLREVAGQTYGPELAQRMLELKGGDTIIKVRGLASPPSLTRADRRYLSFFVNRRWVRSPLLLRATEQAYHGLLMDGKHPIVIIDLSLPPSEVDVNVHPTKAELKFCRDQAVFASVEQAIRGALARTAVATPMGTSLPAASEQQQSAFMIKEQQPGFAAPLPAPGLPALRVMGQLATTYIIAEGPEGLYLIDQHAAHERILYEKILSQWERQELEIQGLLQPATMELSPRQEQILQSNGETLARLGFTIEPFGNRSYLVRAVPAVVAGTDVVQGVTTLLDTLASLENAAPREEKMAESLACHSAIRAGQRLSNEEMAELIRQLEQARQPRSCPHGRPTMIHLSSRQLEREFGRIT
ncbi:MAG: DNA mismatch repair endonuclease MutL [Dehalococcoidia bacterium]|nr:DNA mismatch repair endonuclease MutL [Dehalococcoidia bacterium]